MENRLRVLRAERKWNQREVAQRLGCGLDRYWKIENEHTEPEEGEIKKLARIFRVAVNEVFPSVQVAA
jgi:putative transcriptional regulator